MTSQTFIYKVMILGLSFGLSLSAIALDFTDTQALAEQGDFEAQVKLGYSYAYGEDVEQDYTMVFEGGLSRQ